MNRLADLVCDITRCSVSSGVSALVRYRVGSVPSYVTGYMVLSYGSYPFPRYRVPCYLGYPLLRYRVPCYLGYPLLRYRLQGALLLGLSPPTLQVTWCPATWVIPSYVTGYRVPCYLGYPLLRYRVPCYLGYPLLCYRLQGALLLGLSPPTLQVTGCPATWVIPSYVTGYRVPCYLGYPLLCYRLQGALLLGLSPPTLQGALLLGLSPPMLQVTGCPATWVIPSYIVLIALPDL